MHTCNYRLKASLHFSRQSLKKFYILVRFKLRTKKDFLLMGYMEGTGRRVRQTCHPPQVIVGRLYSDSADEQCVRSSWRVMAINSAQA